MSLIVYGVAPLYIVLSCIYCRPYKYCPQLSYILSPYTYCPPLLYILPPPPPFIALILIVFLYCIFCRPHTYCPSILYILSPQLLPLTYSLLIQYISPPTHIALFHRINSRPSSFILSPLYILPSFTAYIAAPVYIFVRHRIYIVTTLHNVIVHRIYRRRYIYCRSSSYISSPLHTLS